MIVDDNNEFFYCMTRLLENHGASSLAKGPAIMETLFGYAGSKFLIVH
jgi:hypothetical protein